MEAAVVGLTNALGQMFNPWKEQKPDMDMASIAKGFGVDGERAKTPVELKAALAHARKKTADGRPYLIDVEVARHGPGWVEDPWVPIRR